MPLRVLFSGQPTGNIIKSSPAVANDVVFVGTDDSKLYAFKASTGAALWSASTDKSIRSLPAVANGMVYVGSEDGKLYAFDAIKGTKLWTASTGGRYPRRQWLLMVWFASGRQTASYMHSTCHLVRLDISVNSSLQIPEHFSYSLLMGDRRMVHALRSASDDQTVQVWQAS